MDGVERGGKMAVAVGMPVLVGANVGVTAVVGVAVSNAISVGWAAPLSDGASGVGASTPVSPTGDACANGSGVGVGGPVLTDGLLLLAMSGSPPLLAVGSAVTASVGTG